MPPSRSSSSRATRPRSAKRRSPSRKSAQYLRSRSLCSRQAMDIYRVENEEKAMAPGSARSGLFSRDHVEERAADVAAPAARFRHRLRLRVDDRGERLIAAALD